MLDHLIDRRAGRNHHHDPPRPLELGDEFRSVFAPGELRLRMIAQELVGPLRLEVPDRDREAVLLDVEREVAPHGPEPDDRRSAAAHARYLPRDRAPVRTRCRASAHPVPRQRGTRAPVAEGTMRASAAAADCRLRGTAIASTCRVSTGPITPKLNARQRRGRVDGRVGCSIATVVLQPRDAPSASRRRAAPRPGRRPRSSRRRIDRARSCGPAAGRTDARPTRASASRPSSAGRSARCGRRACGAWPRPVRPVGVEHQPIGEGARRRAPRRAAAPPDQRRQARQPQRRHGVVRVTRRQAGRRARPARCAPLRRSGWRARRPRLRAPRRGTSRSLPTTITVRGRLRRRPSRPARGPRPARVALPDQPLAIRLADRSLTAHNVLQRRPSPAIIASASGGPHSPAS